MIEGCRNSPKKICHILVFFCEFWRGKDDLHVRKDYLDAVFFLSATRRLTESGSGFLLTNIDKWKCKRDNFRFLTLKLITF
jgi:hypothetical protein